MSAQTQVVHRIRRLAEPPTTSDPAWGRYITPRIAACLRQNNLSHRRTAQRRAALRLIGCLIGALIGIAWLAVSGGDFPLWIVLSGPILAEGRSVLLGPLCGCATSLA